MTIYHSQRRRISSRWLWFAPAGLFLAALFFVAFAPALAAGEPKAQPEINVLLWLDCEDYLLPADDDATKRLCELLTERGIRATCKIVGEKARVLEKRGRSDVIAALKKHDIGYHANLHSVHPTISEYLAQCGFLDGIGEFVRREGSGAGDVRRIIGVETLSCYGQPGASWAPQPIAALPQLKISARGVPCYVDECTHVGLNGKPFWYVGALNVFNMGPNLTRMALHDPSALEPGKRKFTDIADRLRSQESGGIVSIFYHPCEWVHRSFWDGENFAHGANPPREEWKAPPQLTARETDTAFKRFAEYIDHIRATPGVRFITAGELPVLYPDAVYSCGANKAEVVEIAARLLAKEAAGADFVVLDGKAFSMADQFELLAAAVGQLISAGPELKFPLPVNRILGPDSRAPSPRTNANIPWPAFRDATVDVRDYLQVHRRVPARVYIGTDAVPPADFLVGLAFTLRHYLQTGVLPLAGGVMLGKNVEVLPARRVASDTDDQKRLWGWSIHPVGFRAPKILEVARLQAWTLKPAIRKQ